MRKIAALILLLIFASIVALAVYAWQNPLFRDNIYNNIDGTILMPARDGIVNGWNAIGANGFTYILLAGLALTVVGAFFWGPVFYGLFVKKGIQEKLLHKTPDTQPQFQNQPDQTIPVTHLQSEPAQKETTPSEK